jgi:hypothetical protein
VLGAGAEYCDGNDVEGIAERMSYLINDPHRRSELAARGRKIGAKFSQVEKNRRTRELLRTHGLATIERTAGDGGPS